MTAVIESLFFYRWQILHANVLGCILATIGVLIILRSQASYGLLAAQVSVSAGILNIWLWGVGGLTILALPYSLILAWPFYIYSIRNPDSETVLLGGMLFFVGFGEILASIGHFRMNLMQSYFGDVLTTGEDDFYISLILAVILILSFYYRFDQLILFSIDPHYALVSGLPIKRLNSVLFFVLTLPLAWAIQKIGMIVGMGHMILPGLAVLRISNSPWRAILYSCLISIMANLGAFIISFIEWETVNEKHLLPTSSLILVFLGAFCFLILTFQFIVKRKKIY